MLNKDELQKISGIANTCQNSMDLIKRGLYPALNQLERHQKLLRQVSSQKLFIPEIGNIGVLKTAVPDYSHLLFDYQKLVQPAIEQALGQSRILQQSLLGFQNNYTNQISGMASVLSERISGLSDIFKNAVLSWDVWDRYIEYEVYEICKKYHYFISPSNPKEFRDYLLTAYNKKAKKKTVEKEFYKIYKRYNWKALDFYKQWKDNSFLEKRRLVIKDLVSYIRNTKNPSPRVVLPALISQIDGILIDISKNEGLDLKNISDKEKSKKIKEKWKYLLEANSHELQSDIALNIIESVLFQRSYPGNKLKIGTYNFSRHKIMHGEETKGLTKSNMIRAFLLLDFVSQFLIEK